MSEAQEAKAEGMARVDAGANPDWEYLMINLVRRVALDNRLFTADDVFDLFSTYKDPPQTHDLRAFGPVMHRAVKAGWCCAADCAPWASRRTSLHASPRRVWQSKIYDDTRG